MAPAPKIKNLWVAASDGDIERVQTLIAAGASPNDRDENSYTPMHAAASYAHIELLEYLVSVGGDVNLADEDGDTPLYTCESVEAARWLVEHGANAAHRNEEGKSPAEAVAEDHPEVAAYLRSVTGEPEVDAEGDTSMSGDVSQMAVEEYAEHQTSNLVEDARAIMEQAERDGVDPDERLREIVQRAVREGFMFGGGAAAQAGTGAADAEGAQDAGSKRARGE